MIRVAKKRNVSLSGVDRTPEHGIGGWGCTPVRMLCASVFSIILLFLSAAPTRAAQPSHSPGDSAVTLQLKWRHQFQFAGYYAARAKGFYQKEGLDVSIIEGDAEHPPIQEVLAGRADFGVGDADVLKAYLEGKPIVVLASIFQHSPYILMTRADRGLRTPSDLRGKTIMLSDEQGIAQLKAVFRREGMSLDSVRIVPHLWNNNVLITGQVDAISAYSTVEPFQLKAKGVEPGMIRAMDYGVDFYGDTLFTTREQVKRHPERTAAFRRATVRGWEYAMAHPEEVIDLILQMPGVRERGITREVLQYEARAMRDLILPGLVEIGHMNPGRWETIARTYADIGLIDRAASKKPLESFIYRPDGARHEQWVLPLLVSLSALGLIALAVIGWNLQLRRSVARRTAQLQRAEQKLRYHVENSPLAVIEWDSGFRVARWTGAAEQVFGWKTDQVLGKHPNEWRFIYGEDKSATEAMMARLVSGRETRSFNANRNYHKDGSVIDCEWYNSVLLDERGNVSSILSLVLDVTGRKRIESELERAQKKLAQTNSDLERTVQERTSKLRETVAELEGFSYSLVHDMRAPLRAMQGYASVLEEESGRRLDLREFELLRRIKLASNRMDQLITDSLNYSRVLREDLPLGPVNIGRLLRGMVETYPNLQATHGEISLEIGDLHVHGNEAALTQVFSNLLGNAMKFVAAGVTPKVRVWAENLPCSSNGQLAKIDLLHSKCAFVWVEDNGIGIPKDAQERIFGMFQRMHRAEEYPGTGIGLALVRKSLERIGGQIWVDSEPGKGSRFCVRLPLAA